MTSDFGVYIHFPWCRNRCPYCDFAIALVRDGEELPHTGYRDAILGELSRRAPEFSGRRLVSIYFGGGTPSLWRADAIGQVVAGVTGAFGGEPQEVTLEANPVDCTGEAMRGWQAAGVNRLSIGVQSIDDRELVALGRDHRMGEGRAAVAAALDAGFASISADVIVGAPAMTTGGGIDSAAALADLGVPHLSIYELTIEPRAPLARAVDRGEVTLRDDDELADLYIAIDELLCARGYEHYEISSYARPGHRAVHNSLYWRCAEFLGLGNGAASFVRLPEGGGRRWTNARSVQRYLSGAKPEIDELTADELAADRVWLGMRTVDGVDPAAFAGRQDLLAQLLESELAIECGGRIQPTLRGFLHADRVARLAVGG